MEFPAAALGLLSTLLPSPPNHLLYIILTYFTNICIRHSSHNHPASIHHMLLRGGGLPMTPGVIISMLNFTNRSGDGFLRKKSHSSLLSPFTNRENSGEVMEAKTP